jgi:anti-anti-sigma factor
MVDERLVRDSLILPDSILTVVEVERDGSTCRTTFCGEVDQSTGAYFADTIGEVIEEPGFQRIEVHLGEVSFMDSSGINALIRCRNRAADLGRRLVVLEPHRNVYRVLVITGVWDLFAP